MLLAAMLGNWVRRELFYFHEIVYPKKLQRVCKTTTGISVRADCFCLESKINPNKVKILNPKLGIKKERKKVRRMKWVTSQEKSWKKGNEHLAPIRLHEQEYLSRDFGSYRPKGYCR
jgi:hypothetical protein